MNQDTQIKIVTEFCNKIRDDTIGKIKCECVPEYWGITELKELAILKLRYRRPYMTPAVRRKFLKDVEKNKL